MKHRNPACVLLLFVLGNVPLLGQTPAIRGVLTLEAAEQLLMQRSQAVAASRYQLEVSQALRQIVGYKPNPIVHVAAEQVPFWSPVPGSYPRFFDSSPSAASNPVYTAMVTKVIERGGKREIRSEQADAIVDVSRAQIADTFRTQLFQLRQAFTVAILARENLNLAQTIDAQYGQTERLTNVRLAAGDLPEVELMRVRAARLPYKQAVLDSQTAYQQAVRDILNLLNLRPQDAAPVVTPIANAPAIESPLQIDGAFRTTPVLTTLEELRQFALTERPDVVAARAALRAGQRGTALAEAQRKRDVAVGFEYQRVGSDHSAGVIAEFPLFVYNNQKALAL
ncbi:MAG: Cation efflux system protein CusA [Bryobacterales bacterium]|nr:Cation efflux system protein CusA [Bryobacterales bacterium]